MPPWWRPDCDDDRRLNRIEYQIAQLVRLQGELMAGLVELNEKIDAQNAAIANLGEELGAAVARVQEDVEALKGQVAPDLQEQVDRVSANTAKIAEVAAALRALDPVPPAA